MANYGTITTFPLPSVGNAKPSKTLDETPGGVTNEQVAYDANGDLWVATTAYGEIWEFTATQLATGGTQKPHVIITGYTDPFGLAFDGAGDLWVSTALTTSPQLLEYTPSQLTSSGSPHPKVIITVNKSATPWSLAGPAQIAFDRSGNLWVVNQGTDSLSEFTPAQLATSGDPEPAVLIERTMTCCRTPTAWPSMPPGTCGSPPTHRRTSSSTPQPSWRPRGAPTPAVILSTQPTSRQIAMDQYGNLWAAGGPDPVVYGFAPQILTTSGKPLTCRTPSPAPQPGSPTPAGWPW